MEYFGDGESVFRRLSADAEPLEVLKTTGKVLRVVPNSSNSLVAVYTQNGSSTELSVYTLRRTSPESQPELYQTHFKPLNFAENEVIDIMWNPVTYLDAGLMLLTRSHLYCIYSAPNLARGDKIVEKISLHDEYGLEISTSFFSLGSTNSPLGLITLYIGTSDGDVFTIKPFLPQIIELTGAQMREISLIDSKLLSKLRKRYRSWSDRLGAEVQIFEREMPIESIAPIVLSPVLLTLQPYPLEFYEEDTYDLKTGRFELPSDVLVQSTSKHLNFWCLEAPLSSTLLLVGSVKFKETEKRVIESFGDNSVNVKCTKTGKSYTIVCDPTFSKSPKVEKRGETEASVKEEPKEEVLPVTTQLIQPDFGKKLISELEETVNTTSNPLVVPGNETNVASVATFHKVASDFQHRLSLLIKLLYKLQMHREMQRKELELQQTERQKLAEAVENVEKNEKARAEAISKVAAKQQEQASRIKNIQSHIMKLKYERSAVSPEAGEKEIKLLKEIQTTKGEDVSELEKSLENLEKLVKYSKTLPPWYMLETNEIISPEQQQELKIILADQAKQILDLQMLSM